MSGLGDVTIQIADQQGSSVTVPLSSIQAVLGCGSISTTPFQLFATKSPATIQQLAGNGIGPEAAALTAAKGSTVIYCPIPVTTKGTASAVTHVGTGASVMTITLDPNLGAFDDLLIKVLVVTGGTIGTAGCVIQISLDNGRNYGPPISLGTATSYAIRNTGVTVNFTSAALAATDTYTAGTTAPGWQASDIQTGLNTLANSQFGVVGWGSTHIVGHGGSYAARTGGVPGATAQTVETYLDAIAAQFDFTRSFLAARDASPPAAFGGTGEAESAWMNAVSADYSTVSAKRLCVGAANWNVPSAYQNPDGGTPSYRRNVAFPAAAKQSTVPPQRHIGRVGDGPLADIVISQQDASDGFVYHNEFVNGGLDYKTTGTGGRFMTTRLRKGQPGVFITNPLLMAPFGSNFWMMPYGQVMDVACSIVHQVGEQFINDDIRLNPNGTIFDRDAAMIEKIILATINSNMLAANMISPGATVVVDRTNNVQSTGQVNITVTIVARGYILSEVVTIGFSNPAAAA